MSEIKGYFMIVDYVGAKEGDQVFSDMHGYYTLTSHQQKRYVSNFADFQTLVEHGIIKGIDAPRWTDDDVVSAITFTINKDERPPGTPRQIFSLFKKTKGIK